MDPIAAHLVGGLLARLPARMKPEMRKWAISEDMWKRRSAILCQLRFKENTDLRLLADCIDPSLESREFFLQKATGWALREHARMDLVEILRFVEAREDLISSLARREALKHF